MRRRRNRVMNRTRREVRQRLSRRVSENGMSRREWRCRRIPHRQRTTDWACHRWMMPSGPGSLRKNQASTPTRSSQPHSNGILPSQADARARIGHFIDWYNFRRPHKGIDHLAPADRFFGAAPRSRSGSAGAGHDRQCHASSALSRTGRRRERSRERAAATNRRPGTSPLDDFLPAVGEHRPPDEPGDDAGEPQNGGVS